VVSFRDREVREALQACALFVTDHSSVAFDAAYLGRAVIHVPFDEAEFGSGHYARGWFDPDTLGFGPVARTIEELLDHLEAYLANGCVREQVYTDRVDAFFAHRDQGNAERVISQIDALA
jgi:CDP-glycerol glycerophosphotransferase (TagB/SpsB family)